jgi:hypothetical protein
MTRHRAIAATTHRLPNGFQHTHEDLEALAEGFRVKIDSDPFLNQNHLESVAPIGRVHEAYVAPFERDGIVSSTEFALYVTFEVLPGTDPDVVKRFIEEGGFSIAFFSTGLGRDPAAEASLHLIVGVSAELLNDPADARPVLDDIADALPDVSVEIRRYHEHALLSTATLVFAGWVSGKVADKLFDKLWPAFETAALKAWRGLVNRIKLSFDTQNGTVHVTMPANGDAEAYRRTIRSITDEVLSLERGTVRKRVSIMVTEEFILEKHERSLPKLPPPAAGEDQ